MEDVGRVLEKYARLVDPAIKEILGEGVDKSTKELLSYQIEAGGKRLRPALAILSCLACGGKIKDVLYPAAGLEILHNYTLIVDDIIDHSELRRGKPTVWFQFGKSIAQCAAVGYSAAVFQAANHSSNPTAISKLFAKALKTISEGEILDILFERAGREDERYVRGNRYEAITQEDYFRMTGKKSAALLETSCEVGGICARATKEKLHALQGYGFNLGIAFQIRDDILDIFGKEKTFGKKIGKDIQERKGGNIIMLYGLEDCSRREKKTLESILEKKQISSADVAKGIEYLKTTSALLKAIEEQDKHIRQAKHNLKRLPANRWVELFGGIADFVAQREK